MKLALKRRLHPRRLFTIATWLPHYGRSEARGDVMAGLTVGVMLVPQSMAYAMLAGVPPIYGLYASLVPLLIYPIFGTSRHLAVGIVAIDSLIVAAGLAGLAETGTEDYIALALLLALMVGSLQLLMGVLRLGFVVNLLSRPVIAGFTAAAALVIGVSQFPSLLGIEVPQTTRLYTTVWEITQHLGSIQVPALLLGLGGIALLLVLGKVAPLAPGPLIAVVAGTGAVWGFGLDVATVGAIPTGLPAPTVPVLSLDAIQALLPTAVTLALVQFMTVISLGRVFAARHRYSVRPNRELVALGAQNVAGAFFRSVPVSGSFSRSAVHEQAGACTPLANVVAAAVVMLTLLFLTPLFRPLPISVLAAIIVVAAFGMIDVQELRLLLRTKRIDGAIAIVTFLSTVAIGIHQGVLVGIAASVIAIMYRISRPNVAELGHLPGTRSFRDVRRHDEAEALEGILILRVDASFSFANADFLKDLLLERSAPEDQPIRAVLIDASSINDLDTTAAASLQQAAETLQERAVDLYFGGVKEPVLDMMKRSGLYDLLGADHFYLSPHRAVKHILAEWNEADPYLDTVPGEEGKEIETRGHSPTDASKLED